MQPRSFTLDGRRYKIDPLVPMAVIERRIAHEHVGESDARIEQIIRDGCCLHDGWSDALVEQAIKYAISCHRRNQRLHHYVMDGSI